MGNKNDLAYQNKYKAVFLVSFSLDFNDLKIKKTLLKLTLEYIVANVLQNDAMEIYEQNPV